ncbi:MAG TPA: hypothetical protein PLC88_07450 [Syntrophomonas sp.]|jgi:hypothetical protein|nr:hypothetical protein [Syntrophomonas sp.]HRW12667.1 hypothetical protein [Syntrophomonas sp.]
MDIEAALDAVISVFIRNPEISSIQYQAEQNVIAIEMIITENIDVQDNLMICRNLEAALGMIHKLRGTEPKKLGIELNNQGNIGILVLRRDALTLSEEEVDLYVQLAGQKFEAMLLRENDRNSLLKNRFDDIKKQLLQSLNQPDRLTRNIFAYRDRGKMFVFDR